MLVHVVSALFDMNPSMSTHMPVHLWKKCVAVLLELLDLLKEHPNVILDEAYEVCLRHLIWTYQGEGTLVQGFARGDPSTGSQVFAVPARPTL